ncbi:MAG: hypothetical protein DRN96_10055 [Thermoproteota archaeon]|nr:MAG: hypothetical protein DRN96_10055 [Candidatus Korarchaeota archaeon]RLG55649.1 MAG: hypothetical protein DRN99_02060 [Candidatus Korarchaeota archaeon]
MRDLYSVSLERGELAFTYLGYSCVAIRTLEKVILVDPADLVSPADLAGPLDLLVYTHEHYDHFSLSTAISLYEKTKAHVVGNPTVYRKLQGKIPGDKLHEARSGASVEAAGVKLHAIKAIHPGEHPLLYIMEVGALAMLHGADSGYTGELEGHRAQIAFVPVGSPSPTASVGDALKMVEAVGAKVAVPIHGTPDEMEQFRSRAEARGISVVVPSRGALLKVRW